MYLSWLLQYSRALVAIRAMVDLLYMLSTRLLERLAIVIYIGAIVYKGDRRRKDVGENNHAICVYFTMDRVCLSPTLLLASTVIASIDLYQVVASLNTCQSFL
jgi:hypothetical protein